METRTTLIRSYEDFIKLAQLMIDPNDYFSDKKFLGDNIDSLLSLTHSLDDLLRLLSLLSAESKNKTYRIKQILASEHPQLFFNVIHSPQDLIRLAQQESKSSSLMGTLVKDNDTEFNQRMYALFESSERTVTDITELATASSQAAENLFREGVPHAANFLATPELYDAIKTASPNIAVRIYLEVIDAFIRQPNKELFFLLAQFYKELPKTSDRGMSFSTSIHYFTRTGTWILDRLLKEKIEEFFTDDQFDDFLRSINNQNDFIQLYTLDTFFGECFAGKFNLRNLFFQGEPTQEKLMALKQAHPNIMPIMLKQFSSKELDTLFKPTAKRETPLTSTTQFRTISASINFQKNPKLKDSVIELFASSTSLDDWLWLWSFNSSFARQALEKIPPKVKHVFNNLSNVCRLAAAQPQLIDSASQHISLKKLFKRQEDFQQFIDQAIHPELETFIFNIIKRNPSHLASLHQRTNQFQELSEDFLFKLLDEKYIATKTMKLIESSPGLMCFVQKFPGRMLFKFSPQQLFDRTAKNAEDCFTLLRCYASEIKNGMGHYWNGGEYLRQQLIDYIMQENCNLPNLLGINPSPKTLEQLIEINEQISYILVHCHTQKMLSFLNVTTFLALPSDFRSHFVQYAPTEMAKLFITYTISLDFLIPILNEGRHSQQGYDVMIAAQPAAFAQVVANGAFETQVHILNHYRWFREIIFTRSPDIMATSFRGDCFIDLLKANPTLAYSLLTACKDYISILIPSERHRDAINKVNHMLLKEFAYRWPTIAEEHPALFLHDKADTIEMPSTGKTAPSRLPSIASNPSPFFAQPPTPTQRAAKSDFLEQIDSKERDYYDF